MSASEDEAQGIGTPSVDELAFDVADLDRKSVV